MFAALIGDLDVTAQELSGVQWSVNSMDGWGTSSSTISVLQKPRQPGGWAGDAFATPRHVSLTGLVSAPSQELLVDALDRLFAAASLNGFVLTIAESSRTLVANARREDVVLFTYITDLLASWSVQMVAVDPRKFGAPLTASTFLPASTGGLQWADRWAQKWPATVVSGQVSLINPGNEVGSVVLRVDGPVTGPRIGHVGTGAVLVFSSSLVLGVGEWLTVDMDKHTAMANDQASRSSYITSRGWSGFDPGVNVWSFAATSYDPASKLTVTATPAFK